jgi:uncharacterized LabA/DUF88 family protein
VTRDDRLRIAVFIDFDNIEIGVKNTLGASFDAGLVLEALKERGDVVSKTAYSDWQRAGGYSRSLTQHAIKMVQRNLTPGGDKNGADINLALDALEMAFTHPHINAFVIVGGDSDFISLVEKLKQYDKKVFVVGGRQFSSVIMQRNCHEFIAYENLVSAGAAASSGAGRRPQERGGMRVERVPIDQAVPLVTRALQVLSEREVSPQMGLLKSTLLQLDSTFSERSYGAGSFRDFVEKLEKIGVVKVTHGKGGLLVGPAEAGSTLPTEGVVHAEEPETQGSGAAPLGSGAPAQPAVTGNNEDGLREFRRILASGQIRKWPMYLRNVKQIIKQISPSFDERAYGFANLVDLLRAAGRVGLVRVDRDRQGVIRVFQGPAPLTADTPTEPVADGVESGETEEVDGNRAVTVEETVIVVDEAGEVVSEYAVVASAPPPEFGEDEDEGPQPGNVASFAPEPPLASGRRRRPRVANSRRAEPAAKPPARPRTRNQDASERAPRSRRSRR